MTNTDDWHEWPQINFDIDLFDDVQDWVANRFGDENKEVILVNKTANHFSIAIQDPKILGVALLKFSSGELSPNQIEIDKTQREMRELLDAEILKLTEELKQKVSQSTYYEQYIKETTNEDGLFSYNNGVWTNVEE